MTLAKRLAREPLVHFIALGALLFLYFAWRGGGASSSRIVITPARIEHLGAGFARTWQRQPTAEELKALVDDYVREELATREATSLGLGADDTILRRRLRQKFEFLVEEAASAAAPSDQELQAFLEANPERFRDEPRVSLRQVYVSRDRRGDAADTELERLLVELRAAGPGVEVETVGDSLMTPQELPLLPRSEVAGIFGDAFADAVLALEPETWAGPVESGFGPHLVLVREKVAGELPDLASIRPAVERELLARRRQQELDATYTRLLEKYTVVIESGDGGERE